MKRDPISIVVAFRFAWRTFRRRYRLFLAVLATIAGAWVALEATVISAQELGIIFWSFAHLAFLVFAAGLEVGILAMCLALHDGGAPTYPDAYACFSVAPRFLLSQVLYLVMVTAGLVLGIVPGVYLGVRYALFGLRLAEGGSDLRASWRQSATLVAGSGSRMLTILAALLALNALGLSLLGIGLLVTVPVSALVLTSAYRQLSADGARG